MKSIIFLAAIALQLVLSSFKTQAWPPPQSRIDSVSYAIGVTEGSGIREFDSTLNAKKIAEGLINSFEGNAKMTVEEAREIIQSIMMQKQSEDIIASQIKYTKDSIANAKASAIFMAAKKKEGFEATQSGLLYKIEEVGTMPKAALGDELSVHYILTLIDGTKKDSSYDRNEPMKFTNEAGQMIVGFTEAVCMLGKGGKGVFILPAELGYGSGPSAVGPCQALIFDIEMVDIAKVPNAPLAIPYKNNSYYYNID